MESLADLLNALPSPKLLPVYDNLSRLKQIATLCINDPSATHDNSGKRTALVERTVQFRDSIEQTLATVNQPADRQIQACPADARPSQIVPDTFPRPSPEQIAMEMEVTRRGIEALLRGLRTSIHKSSQNEATVVAYKPDGDSAQQDKLVLIEERPRDPLSPPRFKHKRAPPPPPSPPPPVLHSPPRRVTPEQYNAWRIPPCVSNWKNPKGYTVPLDKRMAADGRLLVEHSVGDRFAALTESLYVAEEQAREELRRRAEIGDVERQRVDVEREAHMRRLLEKDIRVSGPPKTGLSRGKLGQSDEHLFDPRLFDKTEGIASGLGADDEAYNLYDRSIGGARSILSAPTALVTGHTFVSEADGGSGKREGEYSKLAARDYSKPLLFVSTGAAAGPGADAVDAAPARPQARSQDDPFGLDAFLSAAKNHN